MSFFALVRVLQSTQSREGVLFTMCCWSASRSGGHIGAVVIQFSTKEEIDALLCRVWWRVGKLLSCVLAFPTFNPC